jgi:hypothetical protein
MRVLTVSIMALGAFGLAACTPPAAKKEEPVAAASTCPDDGPRFPITGKCVGRSINYLGDIGETYDLGEGCQWVMNEAAMAGDEALLFMAAECKGVKTEFEFGAGARSAELKVVKSGLYNPVPPDYIPVKIFTLDDGEGNKTKDKKAVLLDMARQSTTDKKEAAACEVRPLDPAKPDGLLVVDVSDAFKKANKAKYSEVYAACGPYGVSDGQTYWMIKQGYGFFFDLGQDTPDFVPQSLTVMQKAASGEYEPKE